MDKANILKSSEFYMAEGDVLHMLFLDETGVEVSISLHSGNNEEEAPDAPTAITASDITDDTFTANWYFNENSTGYYLDVAYDSAFATFVVGYEDLDVGNVNEYSVTVPLGSYTYYYRLRAYNDFGTSDDSNTVSATTSEFVADDWYLPSINELSEVYTNVAAEGLGGFAPYLYLSSSEHSISPASIVKIINFDTGASQTVLKTSAQYVRAVRNFTATAGIYLLGDVGPAGGYIFYIDGATYYEVDTTDLSAAQTWSNITALQVGTSTAVGTGQANTTAIIAQPGHVNSAAKLCDDYIS